MHIAPTALSGVFVASSTSIGDHRGEFSRLFCAHELANVLGERRIVQINHSRTVAQGTVRGLHYQRPPKAEMKLIRCLKGRVWDVAVDLRAGSPTFLRWHAEELSPLNARMMVIPEGFAHGFQALEGESEMLYLHTSFYDGQVESGVGCDDPRLAIDWPLPISDLSARDRGFAALAADFAGIAL
jgi:dTDP-4-dehydrorhamnose 3,5-epimerase